MLEIVAFYHCKYLFRIKMKMMVETSKLLSMRTELPVVTVTLWLDNVIFLLRIEPEDRFLICDHLVVLEQGDRLHVLAVDLAGEGMGVLLFVDQQPLLAGGWANGLLGTC